MKYAILSVLCLASFPGYLFAQTIKEEPQTKLERFQAKTGSVIIRGFQDIGSVEGNHDTSVSVDVLEITNASNGIKEFGITIDASEPLLHSKGTSYIDLDEIESLIEGVAYISRIDKTATQLSGFQADYRTKGALSVSAFNTDNGGIAFALNSGGSTAYFNISDVPKIVTLLQNSLETLRKIKGTDRAQQGAAANP